MFLTVVVLVVVVLSLCVSLLCVLIIRRRHGLMDNHIDRVLKYETMYNTEGNWFYPVYFVGEDGSNQVWETNKSLDEAYAMAREMMQKGLKVRKIAIHTRINTNIKSPLWKDVETILYTAERIRRYLA